MATTVELIRTKVKRAHHHIEHLEAACKAFIASNPYEIRTKRDPQTRRLHYYVSSVVAPPVEIPLILGDTIQCLRSSLDHLAYRLVYKGTNGAGPKQGWRYTYFPIAESPEKYEAEKGRKVEGMEKAAIDAIDATKPYKGGNDALWRLHRLNNIDKHRLLITAGGQFQSVNIGPTLHASMLKAFATLSNPIGGSPPMFDLWLKPADKLFPLKVSDDLFIDQPDAEPNKDTKFAIEIAFGEPGVIEGEPILPAVKQFADLVDNLILSFEPFL